jgi:hypothetical protein
MGRIYALALDEKTILVGNDARTIGALKPENDVWLLVRMLSVVTGEFSVTNDVRKVDLAESRNAAAGEEVVDQNIL